jgi:hypothetical protein
MNHGSISAGNRSIRKLQPPKVWCRRQKLNRHPLSLIAKIAQIHDPAFHLFLGLGIRNYQQLVFVHFMFQHQQSAVRAHHQRFTHFAELLAVMPAPLRLYFHLAEYARTAAGRRKLSCGTHCSIFCAVPTCVNCPSGQMYRIRNEASAPACSFPQPGLTIKSGGVEPLFSPFIIPIPQHS